MSDSCDKKLKLSEDNSLSDVFGKDSFERFGDDLSEVLLSYLSFEDKFRFECVSKQFQRLVFNKQTELLLKKYKKTNEMIKILDLIFAKCFTIKTVFVCLLSSSDSELINIFRKSIYLNQVLNYKITTEIRCLGALQPLLAQIGPKVKEFKFLNYKDIDAPGLFLLSTIKSCPNLVTVICKSSVPSSMSVPIDIRTVFDGNQFWLKNMKTISIAITYNTIEFEMFKSFVESNHDTLTSIDINIRKGMPPSNSKIYFEELLKLRQLESLKITCDCLNFSVINYFRQLADICHKLKTIRFNAIEDISPLFPQFYQTIEDFKEVKKLNIFYGFVSGFESFPFKVSQPPKNCPNLIQLSLKGNLLMTDEFFDSIDKCLPKLQSIVCEKTLITDKTFHWLSKVVNLKRIDFTSECESTPKNQRISKSVITEPYFLDLIENCLNLSEFKFNSKPIDFNLKAEDLTSLRAEEFPIKGIRLKGRHMTGKECKKYFPQLSKATIDKYL